jgi:septum formation topological specificity factor MinE
MESVIVEKAIEMGTIVTSIVDDADALTKEQKEILSVVFEKVKISVESIMINMDLSNHIKIMQIISAVIKIVEGLTVMKKTISGVDKKAIALACGRKCIKMMKDHLDMLLLYDAIAEPAMETMIDVSRNLNVKEVGDCCMSLFSLFKK